jgi:hypothetical protein
MGKSDTYPGSSIRKLHPGLIEWFEPFSTTNEMLELWNLKDVMHEECYMELVEQGSIDLSDKVFKVLANAMEVKVN